MRVATSNKTYFAPQAEIIVFKLEHRFMASYSSTFSFGDTGVIVDDGEEI